VNRCAACPVAEDVPCRAGDFCVWASGGDPVHLRHIAAVALRDAGRPLPEPAATPIREAEPSPPPRPLAETLRLNAQMRTCPWRQERTDCGCAGLATCAIGLGDRGLVNHQDCWECLAVRRDHPESAAWVEREPMWAIVPAREWRRARLKITYPRLPGRLTGPRRWLR
jgi:hypothetical protein